MPDLNKIISMANIFGVSTDYLLKEELETEQYVSGGKPQSRGKNCRRHHDVYSVSDPGSAPIECRKRGLSFDFRRPGGELSERSL